MSNTRITKIKTWLQTLSFRTGVYIAAICVICYAVSFAQMLLPISVTAKSIIWTVFFGVAKAAQYSSLLILGKAGVQRIKKYLSPRRTT